MTRPPPAGAVWLALLVAGFAMLPCTMAAGASDSRQVVAGTEYAWLRAVGKLQVPGQRYRDGRLSHYIEDCSATLVALPDRSQSDTILTAWHCLEFYRDLSKPITFTVDLESGERLRREAFPLVDGGGMHADWALLRLLRAVPAQQVPALGIHPESADPKRPVTMAGYSRDSGIGDNGRTLTFDPACAITGQEWYTNDTDCTAFKGASGGAVVQLSSAGTPWVCGVISQGDGEGRSTFVPVSGFRNAIGLHLN